MNYEVAINTINKDFCNLFFAKYLKGMWGIVAGYRTVPDYIARMRKQLVDWQKANNCTDELCRLSNLQLQGRCPDGYALSAVASIASVAFRGYAANVCVNPACNVCPSVDPLDPIVTVLSYGTFAQPGNCVLNPPLEPYGPGCFDRHWWPGNVNSILMASFTR